MSYVGKVTDYGGTTHLVGSTLYGTCSTQGNIAAKVVVCSDFNKLITGVTIHVKFSLPNTAASPTLNVNNTGAKPIYKCGSTTAESTDITWPPDTIVSFTYDGTNWAMNDVKDKDVLQYPVSTSGQYEVLFSNSANNTAETARVGKNGGFLYDPSKSALTIGARENTGDVGIKSFAQGLGVIASGESSHAEGWWTTASGYRSHAEGYNTIASGNESHAEGYGTTASGAYSHAEGHGITTSGVYSHAEGYNTTANHASQHVFGEYNISDPSTNASTSRGTYVEIVGNGTSDASSNARTLDWSGNQWIAGNYSDTNGLLAMKEVTQAQYDALTSVEKNNGTAYFITDRLSPAATDLWTKVGTATLTTTAQNCSAAINELKGTIVNIVDAVGLALISGWNTATTATAFNLSSGMKFSDYRFLVIQIRNYNNIIQTQTMLRSYFESTSNGARPLFYINTDQYIGHVEVYYKSDTSVYIKVNSGNSFTANYRVYILGIQHSLS